MDEIEKFLRRAAARGAQPIDAVPEIQYVEPEIVEAEPVEQRELSRVARRHVVPKPSARRTDIGEAAHRRMEEHIHQRLDHDLSHLPESSPGPEESPAYETEDETPYVDESPRTTRASSIARLFRSPASIQQAIILSEVLRRPEI